VIVEAALREIEYDAQVRKRAGLLTADVAGMRRHLDMPPSAWFDRVIWQWPVWCDVRSS
jgi:hypothetical protein